MVENGRGFIGSYKNHDGTCNCWRGNLDANTIKDPRTLRKKIFKIGWF